MRAVSLAVTIVLLAGLACTDSTSPESVGAVRVTAAFAGVDQDTDGLTVSVDGGAPVLVLPPASVVIELDMGHHTLVIGGLAPNCAINGPDTRSLAINAADTLDVSVLVNCTSLTGVVEVRMPTTGPDPDPDGYAISFDGGPAEPLLPNGVLRFADLPAGTHHVAFSGLAPNCNTTAVSPVEMQVQVGQLTRDTAHTVIGVACVATTGVVEVRTTIFGPDPDPDGYSASLDAGPGQLLAPSGVYWYAGVAGGPHSLSIGGIAPNCTDSGPNPRQFNLSVGASIRDTVRIDVNVTCTATTGVIAVQTTTTGPDQDPNGFIVSLDGGLGRALPANSVVWIPAVPGGVHSLAYSGFAPNCSMAGPNPVQVTVSVGGAVQDTVHVTLTVTCTATTGAIRVRDVTTGLWQPSRYLVSLDGGATSPLLIGTSLLLGSVLPGNHSVELTDVPSTCTLDSPNPVTVSVAISDTAEVEFDLSCTSAPSSGARLVLTTTGSSIDPSFHLQVWSDCYYCYLQYFDAPVSSNSTVGLSLTPGGYIYLVSDVANNCSGSTYGSFTVANQQITTVPLGFVCTPTGTLSVSVPVSGPDPDPSFYITVDGVYAASVAGGASVQLPLAVGGHAIGLADIASNCAVVGPNPAGVTITANTTTALTFAVTCVANPILQVSVVTTGSNAPAGYLVGVDADYYYNGYAYSASIAANGVASLGIPPGYHYVTLNQVPLNCTVTSANNVLVLMTLGMQRNLTFVVVCH